jgi:hypothetical protein
MPAFRFCCLLLLALPLSARAQQAPDAASFPDPARLRAFGQNGVGLTLHTNAVCRDDYEEEIEVSGSLGNGFRAVGGKAAPTVSVRQALAVPQGQPLEFPGAAYQCLKAASAAFAAK